MRQRIKNVKGITLIALVITIIVLLILAGVSIATLTGENGILTRANESKTQTEIGEEEEAIRLAYNGVMADNLGDGVMAEQLENELQANGYNVAAEEVDGKIKVTFGAPSNRVYAIDSNGNITQAGTGEVTPPTGNLPSTAETTPFLPDGATVTNADLGTGVTIKDEKDNEWTWIEVPRSIYDNEAYYTNGATKPENSEDYTNIETIMQNYASSYRSSYTDEWYSVAQHGFESADEYNNHKNAMLKSVYENGGFYIGKYEVGSFDNPVNSNNNTRQAVIQQGAYPYNWVTCSQAQELSESLAVGGKTSSLMFGIQWDLVMAYLEANGVSENDLKVNSGSWGNYSNEAFDITRGKYSTDYGASYTEVNGTYQKPASSVLLTTGATERNSKMNIYDLAGNVWEWTLEKSTGTFGQCAVRGGSYGGNGSVGPVSGPASGRYNGSTSGSVNLIGFRPALY